jgi:hypothetical protein
MLNIYNFHDNPQSLAMYSEQWRAFPEKAVDKLVEDPNNQEVKNVVLRSPKTILMYVKKTKKPFPEGLEKLSGDLAALMGYARVLHQRNDQLEQMLIADGDPHQIYYYIFDIVGGPWKQAEHIIAKNQVLRRNYVRDILGGDWTKLDKGQYDITTDWEIRVEEMIESIVDDINEQGWDDIEDDGVDANYNWVVSFKYHKTDDEIEISRKGHGIVGYATITRRGRIELRDANHEITDTVPVDTHAHFMKATFKDYVNDILLKKGG